MRIPLRCKVSQVSIVAAPGKPKGRICVVILEISGGGVQFETTIKDGAYWLSILGKEIELHAAELLKVVPGWRSAPLD
jgi:hypothetical protein